MGTNMTTNLSTTISNETFALLATEVTAVVKDTNGNVVHDFDGKPLKQGTGKFWHTFRTSDEVRFGVKIPALDSALPTSIEIDGHTAPLTVALQDATYTDFKTKKVVTRTKRSMQAKGAGDFHSATLGEPRAYTVTITDTGDDVWNVTIKVTRVRSAAGSSASPESKRAKAAATLAALRAFGV